MDSPYLKYNSNEKAEYQNIFLETDEYGLALQQKQRI